MGLLFLVILTLFLPSCAGANLRKLGVEAAAMNNSRALSAVSRHLTNVKIYPIEMFENAASTEVQAAIQKLEKANIRPTLNKVESLKTKEMSPAPVTFPEKVELRLREFDNLAPHKPREVIVDEKKLILKLDPIRKRMENYPHDKLSVDGLSRLLELEIERGRRWDSGQILHKQSGTGMALERTEEEKEVIRRRGGAAPLMHSSIGRDGQMINKFGEKVMSFCVTIRHKDGGPFVRRVEGKQGYHYANKEDVEMVIISSSNQAKSNWITVKGGRNIGEQPEQAALRETLEECGPKKPGDKVEMSRWETWVMDGGEGQGIQYGKKEGEAVGKAYEMFSEDGRLRGLFAFDDAVALIKHSDPVMAANLQRVERLFGTQQRPKDAKLAKLKLKMPEETKPEV
ncbi:unnamed protein product [Peronospora farinosa]|uniref:Nudix hydrolase domain-containing protein n=1 Tax=Peronospora farinosa TaxID=134698 RepID=A0AAV0SRY3_9STRA|nr:unnamed protein product [Peronospora farinosa]